MTNIRRSVASAAVAALLVGVGPAQEKPRPADAPKPNPPGLPKKPTVMQRKLSHAQKVLEGLAKEDYDAIRTGSDGLIACVRDASWRINDTDKYLLFSDNFRRSVEGLQKAAKDKKIDAAALAYVDMTLACVKCHRYMRDEGIALAPAALPPAAAAVTSTARRP